MPPGMPEPSLKPSLPTTWIWATPRHLGVGLRPPNRCGPKRRTQEVFNTKVVTRDTEVTINAFYKHSRIKQYLKEGRALRIETVVNSPTDLGCLRRLTHLDEVQAKARDINHRLLDTERVGQGCVLESPAFERISQPTTPRMAGGLQPNDSATLGSWPCSALCVSASTS